MAHRLRYNSNVDLDMCRFILEELNNKNIHANYPAGSTIWQLAKQRNLFPGFSVQSLSTRFRRNIWPNLSEMPLPPDDSQKLKASFRQNRLPRRNVHIDKQAMMQNGSSSSSGQSVKVKSLQNSHLEMTQLNITTADISKLMKAQINYILNDPTTNNKNLPADEMINLFAQTFQPVVLLKQFDDPLCTNCQCYEKQLGKKIDQKLCQNSTSDHVLYTKKKQVVDLIGLCRICHQSKPERVNKLRKALSQRPQMDSENVCTNITKKYYYCKTCRKQRIFEKYGRKSYLKHQISTTFMQEFSFPTSTTSRPIIQKKLNPCEDYVYYKPKGSVTHLNSQRYYNRKKVHHRLNDIKSRPVANSLKVHNHDSGNSKNKTLSSKRAKAALLKNTKKKSLSVLQECTFSKSTSSRPVIPKKLSPCEDYVYYKLTGNATHLKNQPYYNRLKAKYRSTYIKSKSIINKMKEDDDRASADDKNDATHINVFAKSIKQEYDSDQEITIKDIYSLKTTQQMLTDSSTCIDAALCELQIKQEVEENDACVDVDSSLIIEEHDIFLIENNVCIVEDNFNKDNSQCTDVSTL